MRRATQVAGPAGATSTHTVEAAVGRALHRLLEWAPLRSEKESADPSFLPAQLRAVGAEFLLDAPAVRRAADMATTILGGEGRWAWSVDAVDWHANEVALLHGGELLRIDRLVRRRDTGQWWVLDYKSARHPQRDPVLRAQLRRYRNAVRAAWPGASVRVAFLTGHGGMAEIDVDRGIDVPEATITVTGATGPNRDAAAPADA